MNLIQWILQIILAIVFASSGSMKIMTPKTKLLKDKNFKWVKNYSSEKLKQIGAIEILGAIGLIVPNLTNTWQWVTPLSALGLAAIMFLASQIHAKRKEPKQVAMNIALLFMALFVALTRF